MKIGELAKATGTTTKTLRYYEEIGLLPPAARTSAGYRDYAPDAAGRIRFIQRGQAASLTLAQIRQVLNIRDQGSVPCSHVTDLLTRRLADIDSQIASLTQLRSTVADLQERATTLDPNNCNAGDICHYL